MKTLRAAAICGMAMALLCVGARRAAAGTLEDDKAADNARFDNAKLQRSTADTDPVQAAPGAPRPPLALTRSARTRSGSDVPMMDKIGEAPGTLMDNWKPLLAGAALGGLIGVGIGSVVPVAGPVVGGIIGAAIGAGAALMTMGDQKGSDMGKILGGAGVGAIAGMAFGSAFPIIGTVIGGVAGALFGAAAGYYMSS